MIRCRSADADISCLDRSEFDLGRSAIALRGIGFVLECLSGRHFCPCLAIHADFQHILSQVSGAFPLILRSVVIALRVIYTVDDEFFIQIYDQIWISFLDALICAFAGPECRVVSIEYRALVAFARSGNRNGHVFRIKRLALIARVDQFSDFIVSHVQIIHSQRHIAAECVIAQGRLSCVDHIILVFCPISRTIQRAIDIQLEHAVVLSYADDAVLFSVIDDHLRNCRRAIQREVCSAFFIDAQRVAVFLCGDRSVGCALHLRIYRKAVW